MPSTNGNAGKSTTNGTLLKQIEELRAETKSLDRRRKRLIDQAATIPGKSELKIQLRLKQINRTRYKELLAESRKMNDELDETVEDLGAAVAALKQLEEQYKAGEEKRLLGIRLKRSQTEKGLREKCRASAEDLLQHLEHLRGHLGAAPTFGLPDQASATRAVVAAQRALNAVLFPPQKLDYNGISAARAKRLAKANDPKELEKRDEEARRARRAARNRRMNAEEAAVVFE